MNPLSEYPRLRKALYTAFWVLGGVLAVWQVVIGAVEGWHNPPVLIALLAGYPVAGAYIGFQAAQNTPTPPVDGEPAPLANTKRRKVWSWPG